MAEMEKDAMLAEMLQKHKSVPFVKRILEREKYPILKQGLYEMSHKMAWAQVGDDYIVFPTVAMEGGELVDLEKVGINPVKRAFEKKNFIKFGSAEEADWFSKNYKRYWSD